MTTNSSQRNDKPKCVWWWWKVWVKKNKISDRVHWHLSVFYNEWMCVCVCWYLKNCCLCIQTFIQSIKIDSRNGNAFGICCCRYHYWTRTQDDDDGEWKKNHLQIFSQQHSTVNGQYAFLLLLPLPRLPFYFPSFFANARFPFIMRVHIFSKAYELISTFLPLAYGIVQRDLFINKKQSTAVQTILLIWCNCSVHLNSILWSNPKVRCYRGFLCVRTCLPMDIIIYANVQILYNVEQQQQQQKW